MNHLDNIPVFDGHNDTLLDLYNQTGPEKRTFFERSESGHIDFPRAVEGDFAGGFFAIFVPPNPSSKNPVESTPINQIHPADDQQEPVVERPYAQLITGEMMALLFELERTSNGQLKVIRNVNELITCLNTGKMAAILHFEGAECIEPDLSNLPTYYDAGLRSIGFTWSRSNIFGYGVPFRYPHSPDTGPGLTVEGKKLVRACNRLGIMIDLSHLNEKGFWDVHKLTSAPLVATHSGVHTICQATRNLTDRQIDAIGECGGIVGVNFHVGFLRSDGQANPDTPVTEIVRHIDYLVDRIGIDHVAFGSDFDGAKMPNELADVSGLPMLLNALTKAGYDRSALRKLAHENWVRVLEQTWNN